MLEEYYKNVKQNATPTEDKDLTNKEYVDSKSKTILWADYQALSDSEKLDGTTYYIPDLPVSTGGKVIEEVERLNGYLESDITLSLGSNIPFIADSNSNMSITDGLVTLKKGKTYSIFCDLRLNFSNSEGTTFFVLKDSNGNIYGANGFEETSSRATTAGKHTSLMYTITPSEDIMVGIYFSDSNYLSKAVGSVCKLIITEIPSIQACINISDEHIKEVVNTYSTDEQVVGTWVDGKTLYRRVIAFTVPSTFTTNTWIDITVDNLKPDYFHMLSAQVDDWFLYSGDTYVKLLIPYYDGNNYISMQYHHENSIYFKSDFSAIAGKHITMVVEYTKA